MILLAMDTATSSTVVGLRLGDGATSERRDDPAAGAHPGHATRLLGMADELLDEAGIGWPDVQRIAVGIGPGTFTGLRVGIATARGLAQALAVPLVAVSSLQALAHGVRGDGAAADGVLAVIDARRREVFATVFAPDGRELSVARALPPQQLEEVLREAGEKREEANARERAGQQVRWLGVGDGALRYREQLEGLGVHVPEGSGPVHKIGADALCELAAGPLAAGPQTPYQGVLPDYLRRPDAELTLQGATGGGGAGG